MLDKKQSSLIAALTVCAVFISLLSFLLPFMSIEIWGTYSQSGVELIAEAIDDEEYPAALSIFCPVASVIGLIFAFVAIKSPNNAIGVIISLGLGMVIMVIAMSDDDWDIITAIDYASVGFYVYEAMCVVSVALATTTTYLSKTSPALSEGTNISPEPTPTSNKAEVCPQCHAVLDSSAVFCRFCGTPLKSIEPKPEPNPEPNPEPEPETKPEPKPDNFNANNTSKNWFSTAGNLDGSSIDQK